MTFFCIISRKSAATFCFAIALTATAQLQHGGTTAAQGQGRGRHANGAGLITCKSAKFWVFSNCDDVTKALNEMVPSGAEIECTYEGLTFNTFDDPLSGVPGYRGNAYTHFLRVYSNCDGVAMALTSELKSTTAEVTGIECVGTYLHPSDQSQCDATALALSALIGDKVESYAFKKFFAIALPITAVVFVSSGYYGYKYLGGDLNLSKTFFFALFVSFRVFDLMSDWGMYSISLASQHKGLPLRHACLVFSIIGSILLIVDLRTMLDRAKLWFGIMESHALVEIGCGMLAVVFLEDVPQLCITIFYLRDIDSTAGRQVDAIAYVSLFLSGISMIANIFFGIRVICIECCGCCANQPLPPPAVAGNRRRQSDRRIIAARGSGLHNTSGVSNTLPPARQGPIPAFFASPPEICGWVGKSGDVCKSKQKTGESVHCNRHTCTKMIKQSESSNKVQCLRGKSSSSKFCAKHTPRTQGDSRKLELELERQRMQSRFVEEEFKGFNA